MYILILSVVYGHMIECKKVPKQALDQSSGFTVFGAAKTYESSPCVPGWKTENTPSWGTLQLASKGSCETAGKAWLDQHAKDSGVRATYSCTEDK